jgi:Flp pilus assembly protein TadG
MAGLVIDLGNGYLQKRSAQNVADAAALAGASAIPQGTWQTAASQNAATNDKPGDQVTESLSGGNTVTVTVSRTSPTYILGLFGVHVKVTSTAKSDDTQLGGGPSPYACEARTTTVRYHPSMRTLGRLQDDRLPASGNNTGGSCAATPASAR